MILSQSPISELAPTTGTQTGWHGPSEFGGFFFQILFNITDTTFNYHLHNA